MRDLPINTGIKFFTQRVLIESTGDAEVDKALKSVFKDDYNKTAPLEMRREDVQKCLSWRKQKIEARTGQMPLFIFREKSDEKETRQAEAREI